MMFLRCILIRPYVFVDDFYHIHPRHLGILGIFLVLSIAGSGEASVLLLMAPSLAHYISFPVLRLCGFGLRVLVSPIALCLSLIV